MSKSNEQIRFTPIGREIKQTQSGLVFDESAWGYISNFINQIETLSDIHQMNDAQSEKLSAVRASLFGILQADLSPKLLDTYSQITVLNTFMKSLAVADRPGTTIAYMYSHAFESVFKPEAVRYSAPSDHTNASQQKKAYDLLIRVEEIKFGQNPKMRSYVNPETGPVLSVIQRGWSTALVEGVSLIDVARRLYDEYFQTEGMIDVHLFQQMLRNSLPTLNQMTRLSLPEGVRVFSDLKRKPMIGGAFLPYDITLFEMIESRDRNFPMVGFKDFDKLLEEAHQDMISNPVYQKPIYKSGCYQMYTPSGNLIPDYWNFMVDHVAPLLVAS